MEQNELLQRLQGYCDRYGITDKEVANALRVSRQTVTNWKNGKPIAKTNVRGILAFISAPPYPVQAPAPEDALALYIVASLADFTPAEKAEVVAVIERIKEKKSAAPAAGKVQGA